MARPDDPPPGVLAEIAELIGPLMAEALARDLGGQSLHVPQPQNLRDTHVLARCLGLTDAATIAGTFSGECLYVPRARRWVAARMFARGCSAATVAQALNVSRRAARGYRKAA